MSVRVFVVIGTCSENSGRVSEIFLVTFLTLLCTCNKVPVYQINRTPVHLWISYIKIHLETYQYLYQRQILHTYDIKQS